jgi:hypothetical protein
MVTDSFSYLMPVAWFAVSAVIIYALAHVYVRLLLSIGELERFSKGLLGSFFWLLFGVIVVSPLYGWIAIASRQLPSFQNFPAFLWPVLCYGLCIVAACLPIKRHSQQLGAAGWFIGD